MRPTTVLPLASAIPAPTSIHRFLAADHGLEPRGNHTAIGKRFTVAGWRRLAGEIDPSRCGLDARRAAALVQAMRHLDLVLDAPVRTWLEGRERYVEILGVYRYGADLDTRRLRCGRLLRDGRFAWWGDELLFGIFPAVQGEFWLPWLLDVSGFAWRSQAPDPDDDESWRPADAIERRFVRLIGRMLRADRRFRAMRLAPAAELVGDDVLAIALRAGRFDAHPFLTLARLENVWRNHAAYAEVARQAPALLPLPAVCFGGSDLPFRPPEIMKRLRAAVLGGMARAGIGDAAWRWLLRNGLHWLRPGTLLRGRYLSAHDLHAVLRGLADAGWPRLPAPSFLRAWREFNDEVVELSRGDSHLFMDWNQLPPRLLRMLVAEQQQRCAEPGFGRWCAALLERLLALVDPRLQAASRLGKERLGLVVPRRPDWAWFERVTDKRLADRAAVERAPSNHWHDPIGERRFGELVAVPLTSASAIREEGRAMHHCAGDYAGACVQGDCRFYSLRDAAGRRLATVAIARTPERGWEILDVRGRANRTGRGTELAIAERLAAEHSARDESARRQAAEFEPLREAA